jgi:Flp pilus assembly protein TadG
VAPFSKKLRHSLIWDDSGAAFVEGAIAGTLFFAIVLATVGWGIFFTKQLILTYATNFSARCATIQGTADGMNYCGIYNIDSGTFRDYGARTSMGLDVAGSFQSAYGAGSLCVSAASNNPLGFLGDLSLPAGNVWVPLAIPRQNSGAFCTATQ